MPERDPRDVERIGGLERELEKARGEIADLKKVVEELLKRQRKAKRQANRFAREQGKPEGEKKKAGRKPGHDADWRQTPDQVDASVEARLDGCPRVRAAPRVSCPASLGCKAAEVQPVSW